MKHILIVEDDDLLNKTLGYNLTSDGYAITSALTKKAALNCLTDKKYDLILLDVNLPDGNGIDLCQMIKPVHKQTAIIFLTANDKESDLLKGYEAGAFDYITKPFSIIALQKKIKALFTFLKDTGDKPAFDIFDNGNLKINFSEQTASLKGKPLAFTPMEYRTLHIFVKNSKQVLTRKQLLERLWDIDEKYVDEHTLTTTISRIRKKIEICGAKYIKTIYSMGYQWIGGEQK